ncbi:FAD-dependent oxidoreductase [Agromyces sp. NPDC058110]|uniref:FAD-dependent oxidoreductase n=1 Tax=Agromyces sp. NPDC058110 TaxID=3346345 RepID=UPI0036D80D95
MRAAVVGAGVIGLSVAHELRAAGVDVVVFADAPDPRDCSPLAGAVWFPYGVSLDPAVVAMSDRTRVRLEALASDPATGVARRRGTYVVRRDGVDLSWANDLPERADVAAADLPAGALGAFRAVLPVVDMSRYLPWLRRRVTAMGVELRTHRVTDLDELDGAGGASGFGEAGAGGGLGASAVDPGFDAIVVAAGIRSTELVVDDEPMRPRRGQVVRLANPGLTDWIIDEDAPDGMTYVIPRFDDVVCGGTSIDDWSTELDPATAEAILRRARAIEPALLGASVVSEGVGLRPSRRVPRVERLERRGVPTFACYGHGGAGVSLSWGSAESIVRLLEAAGVPE